MTNHDAFRELAASYALDALDASERIEFEAHLATCDVCQREVAELRPVTAALGLAVDPVEPPVSLKARTMARATGRAASPQAQVVPIKAPAPVTGATGGLRWLPLAASAALIVGLSVYALQLRAEVSQLRQMAGDAFARADSLRAELTSLRQDSARLVNTVNVLSAPDTITVNLKGAAGAPSATGRAYVSGGRGLVFAANSLPPLVPGRIYQLWVIPPDSPVPVSAGTFSVSQTGDSLPMAIPFPQGARQAKVVAVTDEPGPAGSPQPTTPILLVGSAGD